MNINVNNDRRSAVKGITVGISKEGFPQKLLEKATSTTRERHHSLQLQELSHSLVAGYAAGLERSIEHVKSGKFFKKRDIYERFKST